MVRGDAGGSQRCVGAVGGPLVRIHGGQDTLVRAGGCGRGPGCVGGSWETKVGAGWDPGRMGNGVGCVGWGRGCVGGGQGHGGARRESGAQHTKVGAGARRWGPGCADGGGDA